MSPHACGLFLNMTIQHARILLLKTCLQRHSRQASLHALTPQSLKHRETSCAPLIPGACSSRLGY